jgi:calcineurin-like phosphoesterase family protein
MLNTFFTSDTHFGHRNILHLCSQRNHFRSIEEHDKKLVENWNSVVPPDGTVYHLGDVSYRAANQTVEDLLAKLNGTIHLVVGNHDKVAFLRKTGRFASISTRIELKAGETRVILDHFPIEEWNQMHRGAIHLHGHTHGHSLQKPNRIDVGVDVHNFFPVTWEHLTIQLTNTNDISEKI